MYQSTEIKRVDESRVKHAEDTTQTREEGTDKNHSGVHWATKMTQASESEWACTFPDDDENTDVHVFNTCKRGLYNSFRDSYDKLLDGVPQPFLFCPRTHFGYDK